MQMDIDQWIEAVEALDEDEIERELQDLDSQLRHLIVEINKRRDALEVKRRWAQQRDPESSGALPPFGTRAVYPPNHPLGQLVPSTPGRSQLPLNGDHASAGGPPKTKRQAVLTLLRESPSRAWKLAEMREELIQRGWLAPEDTAAHALGVVVSKMARSGEIARPQTGYYTLPTPEGSRADP